MLLFTIAGITFFMSAVLDNLTTSIVMVMLIRKLIANYKERWVFGSIIIIAANAGGAWSPIGDVTTIMPSCQAFRVSLFICGLFR